MKKITALLIIVLCFSSCKLIDNNDESDEKAKVAAAVKDSTIVNDKDENGCLASAGYVWSKVRSEERV